MGGRLNYCIFQKYHIIFDNFFLEMITSEILWVRKNNSEWFVLYNTSKNDASNIIDFVYMDNF